MAWLRSRIFGRARPGGATGGGGPQTLADLPVGRRRALSAVVAGSVLIILFVAATAPGPVDRNAVLLASLLAGAACVAALGGVPWVSRDDRDGARLGTVVDMTDLVFRVVALLVPPALAPLAVMPSFVVDRVWARRPLFAVVTNAVVISLIVQLSGLLLSVVSGPAPSTARWLVAAHLAMAWCVVAAMVWVVLGSWLIRGTRTERSELLETLPLFQDSAMAVTALVVATLWRMDPLLAVLAVGPVAILHRLLHFREVELVARTDTKTALLNYRYFTECADRVLARVRRAHDTASLLVVDMDRMRDINNVHGHQVGDRALTHVADTLRSHCRRRDLVCRFGGEEFLVLMPGLDLRQAGEVAERVRRAVRDAPLDADGTPVRVTISIGVAGLDEAAAALDALIHTADERVYLAKAAGRDRVVGVPSPR